MAYPNNPYPFFSENEENVQNPITGGHLPINTVLFFHGEDTFPTHFLLSGRHPSRSSHFSYSLNHLSLSKYSLSTLQAHYHIFLHFSLNLLLKFSITFLLKFRTIVHIHWTSAFFVCIIPSNYRTLAFSV